MNYKERLKAIQNERAQCLQELRQLTDSGETTEILAHDIQAFRKDMAELDRQQEALRWCMNMLSQYSSLAPPPDSLPSESSE